VAGPAFAHGGFQNYLHEYIASSAVSFYRPVLSGLVLPHAVFFGYVVGIVELLVGISLLIGLWVRPASVLGILFLLNLTLAAWWEPGHGAPLWRYFGARLDTLPLMLLLIIFLPPMQVACGVSTGGSMFGVLSRGINQIVGKGKSS